MVARIASPLMLTLDSPMPSMFASSALVTGGFIFIRVIEIYRNEGRRDGRRREGEKERRREGKNEKREEREEGKKER